jgi:hypothetical protein
MTTTTEVKSAAALERQRLAQQAAQARAQAEAQAQQAEAQTEAQAREAISETEQQAQAARSEVRQQAESRQAEIRKQRGQAELEAEAAKAQARQAQRVEQRKVVLPISKPRDLGLTSYIANVETARKQAHQAGESAKTAVTKVRDDYFKEVDKSRDDAMADISRQKAGIVRDIRQQLASYSADLTKQLANLNSGVDVWEADAKAAINKAQDDYEAAIRAQLDRPGTEVFADMQGQGLIPANAIYKDYDKTTGNLNYTIPDIRDGQEIFAAEQAAGNIPKDATYKDYDTAAGLLTYTVPKKTEPQTATNTTAPGKQSTNVVATAGGVALAGAAVMTMTEVGAGVAAIPTPPTWFIGGTILAAALIIGIIERERIARGIKNLVGNKEQGASSAVVTDNDGTIVYSTAQIRTIPQAKGGTILVSPDMPQAKAAGPDIGQGKVPVLPGFTLLESEGLELKEIPPLKAAPNVIIRDPFDVPEMRQKSSNILAAVAGVQTAANDFTKTATRELSITREESQRLFEQVNEYLRQGRVREGQRILDDMARQKGQASISESMRAAYQAYLRKKTILDAARRSYVASLNPQPIKGKGSVNARAAAAGVWLVQDILQDSIQKSLAQGETLKSAMTDAQAKASQVVKELGLTQQQVNAANAMVVYQAALSAMTQQAIATAINLKTQGLTNTELETRIFNATKTAVQTVTQTAVQTNTLTQTQARDMTRELTKTAEAVAELTMKIKLEKLPAEQAAQPGDEEYPDGTIVWKMGETQRGEEYKIIPPPYTMLKPISSRYPPKGMTKTKGAPQETLTFIGGKVPFQNVSFDLGVTDGFIDVKARKIEFTGGGQKTNVGTRIESTTKGVALTNNKILTRPRIERVSARPRRGRLVSHGVYADRGSRRITRRRRRGWKRIY